MNEYKPSDNNDSLREEQYKKVRRFACWLECSSCSNRFHLTDLYKCLYCLLYFCSSCMEKHCGTTQKEWAQKHQYNE